jgi:hypothetical protein
MILVMFDIFVKTLVIIFSCFVRQRVFRVNVRVVCCIISLLITIFLLTPSLPLKAIVKQRSMGVYVLRLASKLKFFQLQVTRFPMSSPVSGLLPSSPGRG